MPPAGSFLCRQEAPQECGLREALSAKPPSLRTPSRPQNHISFLHRLPASTGHGIAYNFSFCGLFSLCENSKEARLIIDFKVPNVLDRIPPKHCFSDVKARREGFLREGGASRSESNESIAGGNRTTNTSALRREQAAVSAPLEAASYRFSCRSKKTAAGGTQPISGQG